MPIIISNALVPAVHGIGFSVIDPSGVEHELTWGLSEWVYVSAGSKGLGIPPIEHVLEKLPFNSGSIMRRVKVNPVEFSIPILIKGDTFAELISRVQMVRLWFNPGNELVKQPIYFKIRSPVDESIRLIRCFYKSGLEGDMADGSPFFSRKVVELVAPDPYWLAAEDDVVNYEESIIGDELSIINEGDLPAYPVWQFSGPVAGNFRLENIDTGEQIDTAGNGGLVLLSHAAYAIIDTRPTGIRPSGQLMDYNGQNRFSHLTATSSLWWFGAGQNRFRIMATGTNSNWRVQLRWRKRYLGVLR